MDNSSQNSEKVFLYKQWDAKIFKYELEQGSITLMPRPPGGTHLEPYIAFLKDRNVDIVISLLQFNEVNALSLTNEGYACEEAGIEFINFQIKDHSVPQFITPFNLLVEKLLNEVNAGKNIAIHCYAGIGRTGLLAASILIKGGMMVDSALLELSKKRGVRVPETIQQISWLHHHIDELLTRH